MTYRDKTQHLIQQIWALYDQVGGMRDQAAHDNKDPWNKARGDLYNAAIGLSKHDNEMPDSMAQMKID